MATAEFSLKSLADKLDRVSDDMRREVGELVVRAADKTQYIVQQVYPVGRTGNLRSMVRVTRPRGYSTTGSGVPIPTLLVKAFAPHVHIYQEGTKPRTDPTRKGAKRGISPAHGRIFERIAAQNRAEMLRDAQNFLNRNREL